MITFLKTLPEAAGGNPIHFGSSPLQELMK